MPRPSSMTDDGRCSKYVTAEVKWVGTTEEAADPDCSASLELLASCNCALSRRGVAACEGLPFLLFACAFRGSEAE